MTTTARDIIVGALSRIGQLDQDGTLDAALAQSSLRKLNSMMAQWEGRGLSYSHATLALSDPFPIADMHIEGVTAMLAMRLTDDHAPEAATTTLRRDATKGWAVLYGEFGPQPKSKFNGPTRSQGCY